MDKGRRNPRWQRVLFDWPPGAVRTRRECSVLGIPLGVLRALERRGHLRRVTTWTTVAWRRPM